MSLLNFSLGIIVSYLGLYVGLALAKISPEEIKPGRRYFMLLEKILFIIIMAVALYGLFTSAKFIYFSLLLIAAVIAFFIKKMKFHSYYILFAILASFNDMILISLIFVISLPIGTLLADKVTQPLKYIYYPVLSIIIYILGGLL